jgi:hypothetical protein
MTMALTCTFRHADMPCEDQATHAAIRATFSYDSSPWAVKNVSDHRAGAPEFCERHAEMVAKLRNQTQAFYRRQAKGVRCVVCAFPLEGAAYEVAGVGLCCGECQSAAQSEQMHDPEAWKKHTKARRREMVQHDKTMARSKQLAKRRVS